MNIPSAIRSQTAKCLVALSVGQQSYNMLDDVLHVLRGIRADPDAGLQPDVATLDRFIGETEKALAGLRTALSKFPDEVWYARARGGCDQPTGAACMPAMSGLCHGLAKL